MSRVTIRPLYELRRGQWANASYFTLFGGALVIALVHFLWDLHAVNAVLACIFLLAGLFLGCLSGFSKPPFSSWQRWPRLDYYLWSLILSEYILRGFFECFIPWANHAPTWATMVF